MPSAPSIPQVSDALATSTRERFQPRYAESLTDDDGRQIATNLLGMFGLLKRWRDQRDAAAAAASRTKARSARKRRTTLSAE